MLEMESQYRREREELEVKMMRQTKVICCDMLLLLENQKLKFNFNLLLTKLKGLLIKADFKYTR